jgi:DNA processing protein
MNPFDLDTTDIDEPTARVLLAIISAPGTPTTGRLVAAHGPSETLRHALSNAPVEGEETWLITDWRALVRGHLADPDIATAFLAAMVPDPRVLVPSDPDWPTGLSDLGDRAPLALWADGDTSLLSGPRSDRVAVVGHQAATDYGITTTRRLAYNLANRGIQIVSGGAHGIDTEAHHGALAAGGTTIVVLAGGLEQPFPPSNTELFDRVRDNGGVLLTEAPPSMVASNAAAAAKHRIMAALSGAVVAVEAGRRSSGLQTINDALTLGRPVGAVPGPLSSTASNGCRTLIREGATLITNASDVARLLEPERDNPGVAPLAPRGPSPRQKPPHGPSI